MKEPIVNMIQRPRALGLRSERWFASTLMALSAAVMLCQAPAAHAQSTVDPSAALYRCAVLGERDFCKQQPARPAEWIEEWIELGPKAKEFRHYGATTEEAIARARLLGEEPIRHVDRVISVRLTDQEKYERGTGLRVIPSERRESLSVTAVREQAPHLQSGSGASSTDTAGAPRATGGSRQ